MYYCSKPVHQLFIPRLVSVNRNNWYFSSTTANINSFLSVLLAKFQYYIVSNIRVRILILRLCTVNGENREKWCGDWVIIKYLQQKGSLRRNLREYAWSVGWWESFVSNSQKLGSRAISKWEETLVDMLLVLNLHDMVHDMVLNDPTPSDFFLFPKLKQ